MSAETRPAPASTCREHLGRAGWCPLETSDGDYCIEHAAARSEFLAKGMR